jgi:UDP-N-acetylglucosamine--dolichyl-phosphate N-acetylglucosaminephosphotransferase
MQLDMWYTPFGNLDLTQTLINIPGIGIITLAHAAKYLVLPIYIMVAANLVNMHAGFNGLMSGLTAIILTFILLKVLIGDSIADGLHLPWANSIHNSISPDSSNNILTALSLGAVVGFFAFNFYPAKIFEGNIGALVMGSMVGVLLVGNYLFFAGCILMLPHFINFIISVYYYFKEKYLPLKNGKKSHFKKFAIPRKDGTIKVPRNLTLYWLFSKFWRMGEKQSTLVQFSLVIISGIFFLLI